MNWNILSAIGTFGAFLVALVGLYLVIRQIKKLEIQIKSGSSASLYSQMIEIDRYFIDHPEYKPYIYGNKGISDTDADYDRIRSLAEMMSDLIEHAYLQRESLPSDVWPRWVDYIRYLYDSSPIIREHLHESGKWYADNILSIIGRTGRLSKKSEQGSAHNSGGSASSA